jgi:hypothetical protein
LTHRFYNAFTKFFLLSAIAAAGIVFFRINEEPREKSGLSFVVPGGARFGGRDDYIVTEKTVVTNGMNAITVMLWVKGERRGGNLARGPVKLHFYSKLGFYLSAEGGGGSGYLAWDEEMDTRNELWQHLAASWRSPASGGDGKMKMYVDGMRQESVLFFDGGTNGTLANGNLRFFGRFNPSLGPFQGEAEDLRVYNHELTASEILMVYAGKGAAGVTNGMILWYPLRERKTETTAGNDGDVLLDCSGSGNHGKIMGAPVWAGKNYEWEKAARRKQIERTCALMEKSRKKCNERRKSLKKLFQGHSPDIERNRPRFMELNRQFDLIKAGELCNPLDILRGYIELETEIGLKILLPE